MENSDFQKLLGIMRDVPYLIKFQAEKDHAERLLDLGEIYMQSAQYYKELEMQIGVHGQGDIHENEFFGGSLSVGMEFPVYCMYAVHSTQLQNQSIVINKQVIDDFCEKEGYITVCKTDDFLRQFNKYCKTDDWSAGLVQYGNRTIEADFYLLSKKYTAHFFKREDLRYQQEFRIRINEPLERIELPEDQRIITKKVREHIFSHWRAYTYQARTETIHDISEFARQYKIKDLFFDKDKVVLCLK